MAVSGERAPAFSCKNKALAWDKGGNHVAAFGLGSNFAKGGIKRCCRLKSNPGKGCYGYRSIPNEGINKYGPGECTVLTSSTLVNRLLHVSCHPKKAQKKGGVAHIHATRGHCHPFKLTLSHLLAVLSFACSVASLSLPSIFACQVSTDYSMPTLQSAS